MRPFVKWAGGKGQYLSEIRQYYPEGLGTSITKYAEPFVGGGAVFFDVLSQFSLEKIYISDVNRELINTYEMIRDCPEELISSLCSIEKEYLSLSGDLRSLYYYMKRDAFNSLILEESENKIELASFFIFLNRTCYNGLYRVNSRGLFNVPIGHYANPRICDRANLLEISENIQNVKIVCGDYHKSLRFIDDKTFVYFDPPYRPLNPSSFTAYTKSTFTDKDQVELAKFIKKINGCGAKILISNSDPKNSDEDDVFFEELYSDLHINRLEVTRMINSNASKRTLPLNELLVSNYQIVK